MLAVQYWNRLMVSYELLLYQLKLRPVAVFDIGTQNPYECIIAKVEACEVHPLE